MGFLDLFVERPDKDNNIIDTGSPVVANASRNIVPMDVPEEIPSDNSEVVAAVYSQFGLVDSGVFKMEQLIKALPDEMPTATKQQSIKATLSVINEDPADLLSDAIERINALDSADVAYSSNRDEFIEKTNADIENMKKMIADAQKAISDITDQTATACTAIRNERTRVEGLKEFVEGILGPSEEDK